MQAGQSLKIKQFIPKNHSDSKTTHVSTKRSRIRVPDEQRKRARQACESCRQRKEKCYGGIPCRKCALDNTICTLAASRQSTSPEPQQRPHLSKAARAIYLEKVLKNVLGVSTLNDNDLIAMAEAISNPEETSKPQTSLTRHEKRKTDYGGESSLLTFSQQLQQKLGETEHGEVPESVFATLQSPRHETIGTEMVRSALLCLPPRSVAEALISGFFRYVQCNNFYVTEEWIQETLNICYSTTLRLSDNDLASVTTLSMIIALGTQFANMAPPDQYLSQEDLGYTLAELGQKLYNCSTRNLASLIKQPTFESVRACLVTSVYLFPVDLPSLAYSYLGLTVHMAVCIGLHKRHHGRSSKVTREVQTRVWWTLYTLYQRARIFHGHPRTLSHTDIEAERPRPMPLLEPSNGVSNFRNQVALIDITIILEDIAAEIAMLRKARKTTHVANLLFLRRKLIGILVELPNLDRLIPSDASLHCLRLDIHVYLHYWHTRLFLGRPFLLSHPGRIAEDQADVTTDTSTCKLGREALAQDSIDAAISIIKLCQTVHDRIGLARASYATEFTSCRAALLVLIASSITEKNDTLSKSLAQGLALIQQMSIGQGQASSETRVIEALQCAIARLHGEANRNTVTETSTVADIEMLHDNNFRQWERLWDYTSIHYSDATALDSLNVDSITPSQNYSQSTASLLEGYTTFNNDLNYDAGDTWAALFHSQLDEFSLIPEIDNTL